MNSWGQAYQTNSGAGVLGSTPYGPGVFQGTALTAGRTCARYYRHFHSEQGKWIQNTGTKYDNHYISEVIYTETDPFVAYAQSDQCWLLDGLWMAGGNAPSVGLQGPGDLASSEDTGIPAYMTDAYRPCSRATRPRRPSASRIT